MIHALHVHDSAWDEARSEQRRQQLGGFYTKGLARIYVVCSARGLYTLNLCGLNRPKSTSGGASLQVRGCANGPSSHSGGSDGVNAANASIQLKSGAETCHQQEVGGKAGGVVTEGG